MFFALFFAVVFLKIYSLYIIIPQHINKCIDSTPYEDVENKLVVTTHIIIILVMSLKLIFKYLFCDNFARGLFML